MAQQTAIEWFSENIQKVHKMDWDIVFIQAKEMEKQQIIKARMVGDYFCDTTNCEQYYNETYSNNSNVNL